MMGKVLLETSLTFIKLRIDYISQILASSANYIYGKYKTSHQGNLAPQNSQKILKMKMDTKK